MGWIKLTTEEDVELLMEHVDGFHDWYVAGFSYDPLAQSEDDDLNLAKARYEPRQSDICKAQGLFGGLSIALNDPLLQDSFDCATRSPVEFLRPLFSPPPYLFAGDEEVRDDSLRMQALLLAEAVEIIVGENSDVDGVAVRDMNLPPECLLCAIVRGNEAYIPNGNTVLHANDRVILFIKSEFSKTTVPLFEGRGA